MKDQQADHLGRIFDLLSTAIKHEASSSETIPLLEYALAYTEAMSLGSSQSVRPVYVSISSR